MYGLIGAGAPADEYDGYAAAIVDEYAETGEPLTSLVPRLLRTSLGFGIAISSDEQRRLRQLQATFASDPDR